MRAEATERREVAEARTENFIFGGTSVAGEVAEEASEVG